MGDFTKAIIAEIEAGHGDNWGRVEVVGEVVSRWRDRGYRSGLGEVDRETVTDEEAQQLVDALKRALRRHPSRAARTAIVRALGKSGVTGMTEVVEGELHACLGALRSEGVLLFQALLALEDLGVVPIHR